MEKEIKVMTKTLEITKTALEERIANLKEQVRDLRALNQQIMQERAVGLFESVLVDFPEVEVSARDYYSESIYVNVIGEDKSSREILSIHKRSYGSNYLSTYATTLDSKFEFRRLAFNGRIAELFLNDSELFEKLFTTTEHSETISQLTGEIFTAERALRDTIYKIEQAEVDDRFAKLKAGEELEFKDLESIKIGYRIDDCIHRVAKIKAEWSSKKKVNITFTCKSWYDETPYVTFTKEGILEKYLLQAIH
jgi:hypothetical protein